MKRIIILVLMMMLVGVSAFAGGRNEEPTSILNTDFSTFEEQEIKRIDTTSEYNTAGLFLQTTVALDTYAHNVIVEKAHILLNDESIVGKVNLELLIMTDKTYFAKVNIMDGEYVSESFYVIYYVDKEADAYYCGKGESVEDFVMIGSYGNDDWKRFPDEDVEQLLGALLTGIKAKTRESDTTAINSMGLIIANRMIGEE